MKWIEHRRHATRTKPSPHLNAAGVRTARKIGEQAGPFARVITSPKKRAIETAVAMGFAIDETVSLLKDIPKAVSDLVAHDAGFAPFFELLSASEDAARYARKLRNLFERELEKIPDDGRLLVVSHGGVVEWSAIACLPDAARRLGNPIDKSEAIELGWENGKFVAARALRLS